MILIKGCPRCHGNIYIDGIYKWEEEEVCLQCGYRRSIPVPVTPVKEDLMKGKPGRPRKAAA